MRNRSLSAAVCRRTGLGATASSRAGIRAKRSSTARVRAASPASKLISILGRRLRFSHDDLSAGLLSSWNATALEFPATNSPPYSSATRVAGDPLAHAQFLPDACAPQMSATKDGTRVPTRQPRGLAAPGGSRKPPREPCGLSGTSRSRGLPFGTRVRRFWARPAFRDPPLPCRSTRAGSTWDALFASETVATHDIAAARTTAIGAGPPGPPPPTGFDPGAGRCHVRCWIQTPRQGSGGSIMAQCRRPGISAISVNADVAHGTLGDPEANCVVIARDLCPRSTLRESPAHADGLDGRRSLAEGNPRTAACK